jgi:hypothetical protein
MTGFQIGNDPRVVRLSPAAKLGSLEKLWVVLPIADTTMMA